MDRPVRFGILGTARIARKVAAAIHAAADTELVAVASRDLGRARDWGQRHEVPQAYGSYAELLEDPDVDAVYIPLPPSLHAEWTIRAVREGKHVLCEKPLATNSEEAARMAAAIGEENVQFMDATMWLHSPRTRDMERHLRSGELGDLRRVTAAVGIDLESYLSVNPPHSPRHDDPDAGELRLQRALGGGALLDIGWYGIGAAYWAFEELPTHVYGTARYRGDVDVNFSALLWFAGERMASFDCGFDIARRKWFEIIGTHGTLVCDDFVGPWDVEKQRYWVHDMDAKPSEHKSEPLCQEQCMIEHFSQLVRSGEREPRWLETSVATQRICEAMERSAREERVVEL